VETERLNRQLIPIGEMIRMIERLRGENGCPWDRDQTPESMAVYLVEEIYELMEAIASGDPDAVCDELGDVAFHVLFIAYMFQQQGAFDIGEVARRNREKMVRRHPHVFGNDKILHADAVKAQWHRIKASERKDDRLGSVLDSVPRKTPALVRAFSVSDRAARTGFDWEDVWGVMEKVEEELKELEAALKAGEPDSAALELGDVLFTLVNVARLAGLHPEAALTQSILKFEKRFRQMEQAASRDGKPIGSVPQPEKETYWAAAKKMD